MAYAAGLAELAGGLFFAAGFLTPLAALAIAVVMLNAIGTVHWRNGFWNSKGGYEYNLVIWAGAIAVAATGGGRFSLDSAFGWADNLSGLWWGVGVLVASVLISAATLTVGREEPERTITAVPAAGGNGSREREAAVAADADAPISRATPVEIQVGSAREGNELIDTLSRYGLPASLVEGIGLWQVEVVSAADTPPELLHDLFDALESWMPARRGSSFLLQVGPRNVAR
jgi:putative oxidoreductase